MIYKTLKKVSEYCQLLDKRKFPSVITNSGVTTISNGDGSITINGTATAADYINCTPPYPQKNNGHVFYVCANNTTMSSSTWYYGLLNQQTYDYGNGMIKKTNASGCRNTGIVFNKGIVFDNVIIKPQIIDLTEMYGAGNEPTTVEEFREKFPNELYDYKPYCFVKSYKNCLTCTTKNLFDIPLTQGYPSDTEPYDNTTLRTFTFGTYIIGMTRNNYYIPSRIANVNISKNSISFKAAESGWGVSVPFLLTVGKTYTVSCKADNNFYPAIGITYYKEDGTLISFTDSEIVTNNPVKSFTVPENTYYTLILFYGRTGNEYTFSNIQLEEGSTATEYQPYGYIQSRKKSLKVSNSILL